MIMLKKILAKINKKTVAIILIAIMILIGIIIKDIGAKDKTGDPLTRNNGGYVENVPSREIVVEVKGEVYLPGVYAFKEGDRIYDAINTAGGLKEFANSSDINLASKLSDGMLINIRKINRDTGNNGTKLISINSASITELMTLSGIGEAKAKNIIIHREENGRFNTLEEITNVTGISKGLFDEIKEFICL